MLLVAITKLMLIVCYVNTDLINVMLLLPLNPGSDLALLPLPAKLNKVCVLAYSAIIGELFFIAIGTASKISYAVSCLTRYMVVSTPAHLEVAKQVLRYLRGVKGEMIRWCARHVTTEADLKAFAMRAAEVLYARKLCMELGFIQLRATTIYEDNAGCISLAQHMH